MIDSHELRRRDGYLNKLIGFQDTEPVKVCLLYTSSETATVDQAKYYRYHQMLCGCSKAGLQRIYFLEQLGQIFL